MPLSPTTIAAIEQAILGLLSDLGIMGTSTSGMKPNDTTTAKTVNPDFPFRGGFGGHPGGWGGLGGVLSGIGAGLGGLGSGGLVQNVWVQRAIALGIPPATIQATLTTSGILGLQQLVAQYSAIG